MKLKTGCIFWLQVFGGPEPHFPRLERDIKCEVAVIGGGISGALIAYHLAREGIETALVDRRQIGHGSTAASTGLLLYEIDTPLTDLIRQIGRDRAVAAYRASVESVLAFEPLVAELGDPCGLVARPSLYLASEEKDLDQLRAECDARRSMQIDVRFLRREALRDVFNLSRPAALQSQTALEVDPFRLTLQLIRRSTEMGLQVFDDTEITGLSAEDNAVALHASTGMRITARKVVFATGYETVLKLPADLYSLTSTYAMASEPAPSLAPWLRRCLLWETARPYLYARTTEDSRVIIGGADEDIVDAHQRDSLLDKKAHYLRGKFSELFPTIPIETSCAWAGTFAQTKDGLPYIGTLPQFPHCYFALGYGGNGITFSLLAAQILTDLLLGKKSERAELFAFDR
jgi:glycine/D-amino acid oxidase-like deaminating enzyme